MPQLGLSKFYFSSIKILLLGFINLVVANFNLADQTIQHFLQNVSIIFTKGQYDLRIWLYWTLQ